MPLNIPDRLPAIELLKKENIFVMNTGRAFTQDIRPLHIAILNLMPLKVVTETDLIRLLSNTPLQIELDLISFNDHQSKNTPPEHIKEFYKDFSDVCNNKYDGLIVTGAPVEQLDYAQVDYWSEIERVFDWARTHVTSSMFICWAAQAALFHYYGIKKYPLPKKMFGVFEHKASHASPLFRGFDDLFYVPHSRHTEVRKEDILQVPGLSIVAESADAGVYAIIGRGGREIFLTGHAEYAPNSLDNEYWRDVSKGLKIDIPRNYYSEDNPSLSPIVRWRGHANLLFANWLNYFVYQETPYEIDQIE